MLTLYWRAERSPEADYTTFVHLLAGADGDGEPLAQADGPPQGGLYPTSWWEAGDEVVDVSPIVVPVDAGEGAHSILVGLYRWETMERLPIRSGDGAVIRDAAIRLTQVSIIR